MNGFFRRIGDKLRQFMMGRYGTDKLNTVILVAGLIFCVLSVFMRDLLISSIFTLISYGLMIWAICRTFSRNTYNR